MHIYVEFREKSLLERIKDLLFGGSIKKYYVVGRPNSEPYGIAKIMDHALERDTGLIVEKNVDFPKVDEKKIKRVKWNGETKESVKPGDVSELEEATKRDKEYVRIRTKDGSVVINISDESWEKYKEYIEHSYKIVANAKVVENE